MFKPVAPASTQAASPNDVFQARLKKSCAEFESIFITHMLKSMRESVAEEGLLGNSNEGKIIQSMFDENLALGIARGGGMGLAKVLFEYLKGR
ncbi:MAG: rod-binding protein [Proteobacteria bacterium]|nr:rod-binding protein [Pseudomonadota bacterium]